MVLGKFLLTFIIIRLEHKMPLLDRETKSHMIIIFLFIFNLLLGYYCMYLVGVDAMPFGI